MPYKHCDIIHNISIQQHLNYCILSDNMASIQIKVYSEKKQIINTYLLLTVEIFNLSKKTIKKLKKKSNGGFELQIKIVSDSVSPDVKSEPLCEKTT